MKVILISHFYNESFLLPFWLRHHEKLFDHAVLIDYDSTDNSREIIKSICPNWEIRQSKNKIFDAAHCDLEVMNVETEFPDAWKVVLTTTEFLVCRDLRNTLKNTDKQGLWCPTFCVIDPRPNVQLDMDEPLVTQRMYGNMQEIHHRKRLIHNSFCGMYEIGRHEGMLPNTSVTNEIYIMWFAWSPWPQVRDRKLQIKFKMSQNDAASNRGLQHLLTPEMIDKKYLNVAETAYFIPDHHAELAEMIKGQYG